MVELFTYFTDLPEGINEMVAPGYDGYTVYIDSRLSKERQYKALFHAMSHIANADFGCENVDSIENIRHSGDKII